MNHFALDDISYFVEMFDQFGIDVTMIAGPNWQQHDQITVEGLDMQIESQLQRDADYQMEEWIKKDRAFEAISLIENDGENNGLDGRIRRLNQQSAKSGERPKINLIKGNRDRIVSQLGNTSFNMNAYAVNDDKDGPIRALNDLKDNVLEDTEFEAARQSVIVDAVTYGSGVWYIGYGDKYDNPDLAMIGNKVAQGQKISYQDYLILKRALKNHIIEHIPTFELIRYRGAKGDEARDFAHPSHRWVHRVQQIPVAQAKREYPEYAEMMRPNVSSVYTETNPQAYYHQDIDNTITKMDTYVKFLVSGQQEVEVENPIDGSTLTDRLDVTRYAVAKFTRFPDVGLVDAQIDKYNHNRPPFVQFIYTPSERHACGIGTVKYGRDPMIIHNMLHHGMIEYLATMSKGGGFVDSRLGLTQSDLNKRTRPGTYIPVQIPNELQSKSLSDLIVESRPPQFPSVYSELMGVESRAIDEAMSVPNVYKGIQSGTSGKQEAILQNQADLVHSYAVSNMKKSYWPFAVILYSNLVQFEKEPYEFYVNDSVTGERRKQVINMPVGHYIDIEEDTLETVVKASDIINEITNIMYSVKIETEDVVPHRPAEKAMFYNNFFNNTVGLIENPKTREYLRVMNKYGFRLNGIDEALDRIEAIEQQQMQQQAQMMRAEAEDEQREKDREFALKKHEAARKEQELQIEAQQQED